MICLEDGPDGSVLIRLHVQPKASANRICGIYDGALKLRITAPPVDGKANSMIISFFAKLFKVPKALVLISSGQNSRRKKVKISKMGLAEVEAILQSKIDE